RVFVYRRDQLLAQARTRYRAGNDAAQCRHRRYGHRCLAFHRTACAGPTRSDDRALLRNIADCRWRHDDLRKRARNHPYAAWHAGNAAAAWQPYMASWPAVQAAVQTLENLRVGNPGLGDR